MLILRIINLESRLSLNLHCKSVDDDFGKQYLQNGKSFDFTFRKMVFGGSPYFPADLNGRKSSVGSISMTRTGISVGIAAGV